MRQNLNRIRIEGGEAFLVNCGQMTHDRQQTTGTTRWHKLILGLKAGGAKNVFHQCEQHKSIYIEFILIK